MSFNTKYLALISILLIIMLIASPFFVLSEDWDDTSYNDDDDTYYEDNDGTTYDDSDDVEYDEYDGTTYEEEPADDKSGDAEISGQVYNDFDPIDEPTDMPGNPDPDLPNEQNPDKEPVPAEEPDEPVITEIDGIGLHITAMRYDDKIHPGDQMLMTVYMKNNGDIDLDNTELTIVNQELALRAHIGPFDFNDGLNAKKKLLLEFPEGIEQGTYYLRITIQSKDIKRIVYREVDVV